MIGKKRTRRHLLRTTGCAALGGTALVRSTRSARGQSAGEWAQFRSDEWRPTTGDDASAGTAADEATEQQGRPEDCDCGEWHRDIDIPCDRCSRAGFDEPAPE